MTKGFREVMSGNCQEDAGEEEKGLAEDNKKRVREKERNREREKEKKRGREEKWGWRIREGRECGREEWDWSVNALVYSVCRCMSKLIS